MPTHNDAGRSRRLVNGWPEPAEVGCVYTLHFARPLGDPANRRGHARHYTGFALEHRLAARLGEHWDARCGVRLVVAFRRAGIPFAVVSIERGVTRARENQLKLRGAAGRCPICRGQTVDSPATLLTETNAGRDQDRHRQEYEHGTARHDDGSRGGEDPWGDRELVAGYY